VPVVPDVEGEPAAGHQVGTITAEPATVEVIGPISAIKELTRAMTEPVSVDGASAPVREAVNVGVPDPAVRLRTPLSAIVMVDIIPAPNDRTVANVAVSLRGGRGSVASLKPSQVTVAVRGSRDRLDGLRSAELEASVDVAGLTSGQYQLPVRVIAPARIQVVRVDPARVQVSVR
jgi:YbbR domain-containing protein